MNIIQAIQDRHVFRDFLADADGDIASWQPWTIALRCLYGLPIPERHHGLVKRCTGRDATRMPATGFNTALLLTGRRCGKSRISATVAAYEAVLAGRESKLASGEKGLVPVIAPTVRQARIIAGYIRAIFNHGLLKGELAEETQEGFELKNGLRIEILTGDWRHVRGFTCCFCAVDEVCFFGHDEDSKVKSDKELIGAIQPALVTTGAKLLAISSPHARKGFAFETYDKNWGNDSGSVLVWNAPSRVMNPNLPESAVRDALAADLAKAKAEWLGEWRDDVGEFLPRTVIERLVVKGRLELPPMPGVRYACFCDMSGGRGDDAVIAIGHTEGRVVVLDYLRRWRPPFSPTVVIGEMAADIRRFNVRRVYGDAFGAEFTSQAFASNGLRYEKSDKNKSELYLEALPRICAQEVQFLDIEALVSQFAGLERRVRVGGRDQIDSGPGGHDDVSNACAGLIAHASSARRVVGAL